MEQMIEGKHIQTHEAVYRLKGQENVQLLK
jgi:hypothetical protein